MRILDPVTTLADVGNFVADIRMAMRPIAHMSEMVWLDITGLRRNLKKLEEANSPFNESRIDKIQETIKKYEAARSIGWNAKVEAGKRFMEYADWIDANTSFDERVMLFNVNKADVQKLPANASAIDIVFSYKLSDSAEHRDKDFEGDVLTEACIAYFHHQLVHNKKLADKAHELTFGKGGIFEFIPTYSLVGGDMVRNPPKLRVADECDVQSKSSA